ncbi:MAG: Vacuolar protein sorting-associated protein 54 [Piccolia ochrophora]|nr:MAG: Vacuolar protein sorting-associated protein 54 [Piccolia ochrophora]
MSSPVQRRSEDSLVSPLSTAKPSQFPFPQYDGSEQATATGKTRPRQGSSSSSLYSRGGTLDTRSSTATLVETKQNAISTLLQPPIVRTGLRPHTALPSSSAHKPPSSRDIAPVALTNIPHVEPSEFRQYLSQVGSLFEAFQRGKDDDAGSNSQAFHRDRGVRKSEKNRNQVEGRLSGRDYGRPTSPRSGSADSVPPSPTETPPMPRRSSGGMAKRTGIAPTPLATVPSVYFEPDFHLENPRTFDIVSERSDVVPPVPGTSGGAHNRSDSSDSFSTMNARKPLATNAILQEKLSWYMDTIEVHLISSISTASTSFFAALGSLRELHSEAANCVTQIKDLRADLHNLDQRMAVGGLNIVAMRQRRENMRRLGDAVAQLRTIVDGLATCEDLVERGEVEQAMDNMEEAEILMAGEPPNENYFRRNQSLPYDKGQPLDLRGARALSGATKTIERLRMRTGRVFEGRFLGVLIDDLRRHINDVPARDTLQRWDSAAQRARGSHSRTPSAFPAFLNVHGKLRGELLSNLNGLSRSNYVLPATSAYSERVLREIKNIIRTHLPSSDDDDNESMASVSTRSGRHLNQQEKSSILARNLRALEPDDAEDLLKKIYAAISEFLRRLGVQVKVLLDVTSGVGSPPTSAEMRTPPRSPMVPAKDGYMSSIASTVMPSPGRLQEDMHQALDMSSLLGRAVDIAQTQITKVINVRKEQTTHLSVSRFVRYFILNRLFADECEAVSGRGGAALKTAVNAHIREFVSQLGDAERQSLAHTMDVDLWDAKDFGEHESEQLSRVLEGSTQQVASWSRESRIWEVDDSATEASTHANGVLSNGTGAVPAKEKIRSATLEEQKFILPSSAIAVLQGVEKLEHLISGIPSITQEVSTQLLEYLKLFNSRSCQLILGAGATRSAGLRNITTKHLALASQSLSFIITLIPYIREFVRRHSSSSQNLTAEFDKVKRLYQDHQAEIHDKLVDIMSGRATSHVNAMKKIKWDDSAGNVPPISPYMETLTKETNTLHRVLSKHLQEVTVQMIMRPVFESYKAQWGKAFAEASVMTQAGKKRMLRDVEHFKSKISKLEGGSEIGDFVVGIVQDKHIENDKKPSAREDGSADVSSDQAQPTEPAQESSLQVESPPE